MIVQPEFFVQGGVTSSPYVLNNMGRFRNLSFVATTVSKIEGSPDAGTTWTDVTSLGTAFTGGFRFMDMAFQSYRVTFAGTLLASAN